MQDNINFITIKDENIQLNFSTAEENMDFNKSKQEGLDNLDNLKKLFNLKGVSYLKQIHSDKIYMADGVIHQGDALITNKRNVAIGVFNADCVPVLIYDKKKGIIAAVHSGWKGTLKQIVYKTINKMTEEFGARADDINLYIGPHNRGCCYEFGKDEAFKFAEEGLYDFSKIYADGKLNLSACIIKQAENAGIADDKVHDLKLCTYCSKKYKFFSYRRHSSKRMFSFIFMK